MVEILDAAAQILCPTQESFNTCQQFINEFASQGPIQQLLFFLFFPTVFIILFVFILTRALPFLGGGAQGDKAHQGLRLLLSVAFYAFIIVQGWYSIALVLAKFWFVVIIVLGGLWFFVGGHFGKEGKAGQMLGVSGSDSKLRQAFLGRRIINPVEWKAAQKLYDEDIKVLNNEIKKLEELKKKAGSERERAMIIEDISTKTAKLETLEKKKKMHLPYDPS